MATAIAAALIGAAAVVAGVVIAEWLRRRWERRQRARTLYLSVARIADDLMWRARNRRTPNELRAMRTEYVQLLGDLIDLLAYCEAKHVRKHQEALDGLLDVYDRWVAFPTIFSKRALTEGEFNAFDDGMGRARPLLWKHPPTSSNVEVRGKSVEYLVEHGLDAPLPPPESD
jgi:hypothetical protein